MSRIANHIRRNIVGCIALFVALGGTAWASGTIGSADVIDNSLRSVDLRDNAAVGNADVVPDSLTGADIDESTLGKVPNADKLDGIDLNTIYDPRFLKTTDTAAGKVGGEFSNLQLHAGAVTGSNVQDGSLTRSDLSIRAGGAFGSVTKSGNLFRSSHIVKVTRPSTGVFCITADSTVDPNTKGVVATPNFASDDTKLHGTDKTDSGTSVTVEWNSDETGCPDGTFEVDTFSQILAKQLPGCFGDCVYQVYDNAKANEGFSFAIP